MTSTECVDDATVAPSLFEGDTGELSAEERACLHAVLTRRYISESGQPELWQVLLVSRDALTSRLNDLYLGLHVDAARRVAYKVPVEGAPVTVLRSRTASREMTLALVYLRSQYHLQSGTGGRVMVDFDAVADYLASHSQSDIDDEVKLRNTCRNHLHELRKDGVVSPSADDPDRIEVLPVIETIVTASRLEAICAHLTPTADDEDPAQ